jgi:hypothetical protein
LSGAAAVPLDYMFGENNAISSNIIKTINSFPYILAGTPESAP